MFDKDTFSSDDQMGNAVFDIQPFVEAVQAKLEGIPDGTVIMKVIPSRQNCLAEESAIYWSDGKVVQDMALRLNNTRSGEVQLRLQWLGNLRS